MEDPVPYQAGRPRMGEDEKRSELLKSYVTQSEAVDIKIKCQLAGLSVSDFLRELALNKEIRRRENPDDLKKISGQLGKIGSNLNQIARKINSGGEGKNLERALVELIKTLKKI